MPSPHTTGSGRHRASSARSTALLSGLRRRPSHKSALKGLGLAASALGVATAFAAPAPASTQAFELTSAELRPPVVARAEAVSAPAQVAKYGVIGFTAKAAPKAKAGQGSTADGATSRSSGISRNTSRVGLSNVGGMTPNAIAVINAVKAQFPGSGPFGGYRPGDPLDHGTGHAVDIMCSTTEGNTIASFLQAHAGELNIKYLIWRQRIWYPGGSWKAMADRGSPTANHMDHVHVSVF
ncbi:hypothetical protein [Pedococcus bigeumensis]|uniref:ARB-07466-like C-terminal domain-containing protein n=1 Tax=Pedococcus bigeumensis TaxID=433644 RepID=A0A502D1I8_9MICO|nr:hypothetical protein [Pedococcus bigeumensis]TPG19028.1 hypothetical protein EAH86_00415 [Pedococcus bigeumensis]